MVAAPWQTWAQQNQIPFLARLTIKKKGESGRLGRFDTPTPAQVKLVEALSDPELTALVALKSRQVYWTTGSAAYIFHDLFARTDPFRTLIATNHNSTTDAVFEKYEYFINGLPQELRTDVPFKLNRSKHWVTNRRSGGCVDMLTAGGGSGGRGWNYQRFVAEELAFWPNAANQWTAITSAVDDNAPTIVISTPNGPGGLYHEKVLAAQRDQAAGVPGVHFLFTPWYEHAAYRRELPPGWEPTEEEYQYGRRYALDMEQLYWRHWRINGVKGVGIDGFMREYPTTIEDGFLSTDGSWYDVDYLNALLIEAEDNPPLYQKRGLRIYRRPDPRLRYGAGIDPSWCNGGDDGVCTILDEYGRTVAVYSTNQGGERKFALDCAKLLASYKALTLCEGNKGGAGSVVIGILREMGIKLWNDPEAAKKGKRKNWTTHHGNKTEGYATHRQVVNGDGYELRDKMLITQLLHIREEDGTIEGRDGYHDDHAMSHMLAGVCIKSLPSVGVVVRGQAHSYTRDPQSQIARALYNASSKTPV